MVRQMSNKNYFYKKIQRGRDPLYESIVFSRCNMKIFFWKIFSFFTFFVGIFVLRIDFWIFDCNHGVQAVKKGPIRLGKFGNEVCLGEESQYWNYFLLQLCEALES